MSMNGRRLDAKVALVSSAGSRSSLLGTGGATAILFSREVAKVFLVDWDRKSPEKTKTIIQSEGGESSVPEADVTQDVSCKAMIEACISRYGALHIVFNNVGGPGSGDVTEIEEGP